MTTNNEPGTTAARSLRVLVIDDNEDAAVSLAELIRQLGHDSRWACDKRSALEVARQLWPQLVFVDLEMPDVQGCELLGLLLELCAPKRPHLCVCLTGNTSEDARQRCRQAGFDGFAVKPLAYDALAWVLQGAMDASSDSRRWFEVAPGAQHPR